MAENTNKDLHKGLAEAADAAWITFENAKKAAQVKRDKMDKMRAQEEATNAKKRAKEMVDRQAEYETRKKAMQDKKTEYESKKAFKDELDGKLAGIDALIAAATGDDKVRLEMNKTKWTAELAAIPDIAGLKTAYDNQKTQFDDDEAATALAAKEADDTAREGAFAALETEYNKLKGEKEKAETQMETWKQKKRSAKTDQEWEENNANFRTAKATFD